MKVVLPPLLDESRMSHVGGDGLGTLNHWSHRWNKKLQDGLKSVEYLKVQVKPEVMNAEIKFLLFGLLIPEIKALVFMTH